MVFWQGLMQKHAAMTPRPIPAADSDANHRLKAIGLMALATLCFAVLDSTGKYLIVKEGVAVAKKLRAPEMLIVPVPAPKESQS